MALVFGIAGLILTGIVFLNADTIVCAIGDLAGECAPETPSIGD